MKEALFPNDELSFLPRCRPCRAFDACISILYPALSAMSKRLNKRQLREQEELAELKAVQEEHVAGVAQSAEETEEIEVEDEEEQGEGEKRRPVNAFAAVCDQPLFCAGLRGKSESCLN